MNDYMVYAVKIASSQARHDAAQVERRPVKIVKWVKIGQDFYNWIQHRLKSKEVKEAGIISQSVISFVLIRLHMTAPAVYSCLSHQASKY